MTTPPPPSKQRTTFVSLHAIQRYQERIENVPREEAIRRIRVMVAPHRAVPDGCWAIESRKAGPPVVIKIVVENGQVSVPTVYPVTDAQITRAVKDSTWRSYG